MAGTMTSTLSATSTPSPTPSRAPITPTSVPWITKMRMTERGEAPSVRRIAMSACLSRTVMTRVETRLKAATAMIIVRITNIMRFCDCTAANQVEFTRVQSRTMKRSSSPRASSTATRGAAYMSARRRRRPAGALMPCRDSASSMWTKARAESNW
jgi:hypothetical protein